MERKSHTFHTLINYGSVKVNWSVATKETIFYEQTAKMELIKLAFGCYRPLQSTNSMLSNFECFL